MKQITFKRLEIKNFKATSSRIVESIPNGGLVVTAKNGAGKSTILEAISFVLGSSIEAQKVINATSKAPAFVSLTVEHPGGVDVLTRTLTPTLDASGKVTASTSSYTISGQPKKQTEFNAYVADLFGTKEWAYLLNPYLCQSYKDARNALLQISGAPSESEFLKVHNPQLAETIGNTAFSDFESREKRIIQDLGKKIESIPGRVEENSAMLQTIPESVDEAPIHQRIAEIRAIFKGVDQTNAERVDIYTKVACEAQELRNQAQKLRNDATLKVAEANKQANQAVYDAEIALQTWNQEKAKLTRQFDQIKAEMNQARHEQADKESQLATISAHILSFADQCREIGSRVPQADGNCTLCGIYCPTLQAKGIEAAIAANSRELEATKKQGRESVALRDKLQGDLNAINEKIDALESKEYAVERRINAMTEAPRVPERKVIESTPESLALIQQAEKMEAEAAEIIKSNKYEVAQRPAELVEEMVTLNDILTRNKGVATTQAQNKKIEQRIEELREEESALLTTQLKHKQHLAQLADFYRSYAVEVTGMVNKLFEGTPYSIKLFAENLGSERGVPVMQPMVNDSNNLSTAENLIFWIRFVERVLSVKYDIRAPWMVDNAECVSSETQFGSKHQIFVAAVDRCELTIFPLNVPKASNAK